MTIQKTIKLTKVPAIYLSLYQRKVWPQTSPGKEKFEASFVLDKTKDLETITLIKKMMSDACQEKGINIATINNPDRICLKDGAFKKDTALHNKYILKTNSGLYQPVCIDSNKSILTEDTNTIEEGSMVNTKVTFYVYDKDAIVGVGCNPDIIQYVSGGSPREVSLDDFDDIAPKATQTGDVFNSIDEIF